MTTLEATVVLLSVSIVCITLLLVAIILTTGD